LGSALPHLEQTLGSITAHSGHNHADGIGRNRLCHRPESNIDARSVARDQWSSGDLSQVTEYPFERFVFVMSILERHSNWDCSLLLGCSMTKIAQARMKALRRLPDFAAVFPRGDALRMRRLGVTA
jgi:hypothetical protein